jgi:glycosyltransferase involved in cell wall biosynthesis
MIRPHAGIRGRADDRLMARIIAAGTYDPSFPRNRRVVQLLEAAGHEVVTCRVDLWGERRYEIPQQRKLRMFLRAVFAYPRLAWRFLKVQGDAVLVLHPGWFDVLVLSGFARVRRMPVLFDAFISLYDTVVMDRKLTPPGSLLARSMRTVDRVSLRLARRVLADTPCHADYLVELAGIPRDRVGVLWVGADDVFAPHPEVTPHPRRVLFYGTFIALHGLDTIARASKLLQPDGVTVRIIGSGQEQGAFEDLLHQLEVQNVEMLPPVPLEQLPYEIAAAEICLGIFGTTDKAQRVVPHKVFECAAAGRPIITADTKGMRSAFHEHEVVLVPPGDPEALATAVRRLLADPELRASVAAAGHDRYRRSFTNAVLSRLIDDELRVLVGRQSTRS